MLPTQPTARIAWISRCVMRLKRMQQRGAISEARYIKLVQCLLGEHTGDGS